MELQIPYGKNEKLDIKVPDKNILAVVYPNKVRKQNESEILLRAVDNPINSKSFKKFLADANDILFIVNDGTRPTPTAKILDILYERIKNMNIRFIIATGSHKNPTPEEIDFIFGKYYGIFKNQIYIHDCNKNEDMNYIGTSKYGTEIYINRLAIEAHKIVVIGSVEPHYFAGYTGGRKSFIPGIVSRKTIEQNHKHALKREAQALVLTGNPIHEDIIDALKFFKNNEIFSIQTVLDGERNIYAVKSGHIHDSFHAAIDKSQEIYCAKIPEKADIVVSIAPYPMDTDLYQSRKTLENGKLALKQNGILIMVSKCRNGIGPPTFLELLSTCKSPEDVYMKISQGYRLGYHKAAKMADIASWAEMWAITDLDDKVIEAIFVKPFHNLQEAIDKAIQKKGTNSKIIFLMDGSNMIPVVE